MHPMLASARQTSKDDLVQSEIVAKATRTDGSRPSQTAPAPPGTIWIGESAVFLSARSQPRRDNSLRSRRSVPAGVFAATGCSLCGRILLRTMRIDAFLRQSPMFAVNRAARRFESLAAQTLGADEIGFLEALVLAALFFEAPHPIKPSHLADTFAATRGGLSHAISALEAKGMLQRKIDPSDARAYLLTLRPHGRRCALRAIAALDGMQKEWEDELGKPALAEMIACLNRLEARAVSRHRLLASKLPR